METIKFRGIDMYTNKWIYGYLSWNEPFENSALFINNRIVHKESVGQFTGQHDKNGTEIYEGDILAHDYGGYSLIVYREECMAFCRIDAKNVGNINGYYNLHEEAWRSCLQRAKVIGNQYENPELLNYKEED